MTHTRTLVGMLGLLAACGGGHGAPHDAAAAIDAGVLDGAVDGSGAVDAGLDADLTAYIPQPPVSIPPAPPAQDLSGNPVDDQNRPILAEAGDYYLVPRPPDALTALSDCTAMIVSCFDPAIMGHTLDACVTSPRRCTTAEPWLEVACCADACVASYEQLRTAGTPPITAFRQAFYSQPSCGPGVDALLGGAP